MEAGLPGTAIPSVLEDKKWVQHCLRQPFPGVFFLQKNRSSTAWDNHSQIFFTEKWEQQCLEQPFQDFGRKMEAILPETAIPKFFGKKMGAEVPGTAIPKSDLIIQCRQLFPSFISFISLHLFNFSLIPCWSWLQDLSTPESSQLFPSSSPLQFLCTWVNQRENWLLNLINNADFKRVWFGPGVLRFK